MSKSQHLPEPLANGPFRGTSAIAAGLLTKSMLRGRGWQRLLPDVYVHREAELDHRLWCAAVGLVLPPGSAIGGLSAAYLWGIDLSKPSLPVFVVVRRDGWMRRHPRISAHYTPISAGDVTKVAGLPVTTPERTAFDLGRRLHRVEALVVMDAMLRETTLDVGMVEILMKQRRQWPNVGQLIKVLGLADSRAESPMESRLRLLLSDAGLPAPVPQFEIRDDEGRVLGRVDLAWPDVKLAVEYEGDHHREREQYRRDVHRVNMLRAVGWTILRFTADDVIGRPKQTVAAVAAELVRRR